MPYDVTFEVHDEHVRVTVTGTRRQGDAALDAAIVGRKTVQVCEQEDLYRVLVILKLEGRLSAIDSYEMVIGAKDFGWDHRYRLALVDTNEESADDVAFTETVAVNRAYAVKAFTDENRALEWLLDGQE
ncbi:MAG: hypothetical protein R3176_00395 [Woeseiaceae bacterium]|nr:hypothetical protein [Woeseiaceae bacterium]